MTDNKNRPQPTPIERDKTDKSDNSIGPLYDSEQTDTDTLPTPPPPSKDKSDGGDG